VRFPSFFVLSVFLSTSICVAQSDYELSLGNGFRMVRCNPVETVVEDYSGAIVFSPMDYEGVGPITHYANNEGVLILRTAGREIINSAVYEKPLFDIEFFFVVRGSGKISGPLTGLSDAADFDGLRISSLEWKRTRRLSPVLVSIAILLFFVALAALTCGVIWLTRGKQRQRSSTTD